MRTPEPARLDLEVATLRTDDAVCDALALFTKRRFSVYQLTGPDGRLDGSLAREDLFDFLKRSEVSPETPLRTIDRLHLPVSSADDRVEDAVECGADLGFCGHARKPMRVCASRL